MSNQSTVPERLYRHELLSTSEAADILHVHPATIQLWIRKGKIRPYQKVGRHNRFALQDILRLRDEMRGGSSDASR